VIALPEGTLLRVEGRDVEVWGSTPAKRLRFGEDAMELEPGTRFRLGDLARA
jgi:hypothetical protein